MSERAVRANESAGEGVEIPSRQCEQCLSLVSTNDDELEADPQSRRDDQNQLAVTDHTRSSPVYGPDPCRRRGGFGGGVQRQETGCPPGLEPDEKRRCPVKISLALKQAGRDRTATGVDKAGTGTGDDR